MYILQSIILCELNKKSSEELETHWLLCKIYKCAKGFGYDVKVKTISEIRNHMRIDHEQSSFEHIKTRRNNYNEASENQYWIV